MKIKKYFLGLIALMILFASCEKIIEVDQPDIIEQDQAFKDKNSTRLSMLGLYGLMGDLVEQMFLAGEIRADLAIANKSADPYIKEYSNNSFSASNPYNSVGSFYTLINNTCDFEQQFTDKLEKQEMDTATYLKYSSELNAIRVWTQYQISKIYGKCKYYKKVIGPEDVGTLPERSFDDTTFIRTLINDLTYSDTINFTDVESPVVSQTVRMNDFYVNELMGELYMDLGDYESALEKFNEVLTRGDEENQTTGRFKITSGFEFATDWLLDLFFDEWESSGLTEHAIFMIAFDNKYNQTNNLWNWTLSMDYQVSPADWFYEKMDADRSVGESYDYRTYSVVNLALVVTKPIKKPEAIKQLQNINKMTGRLFWPVLVGFNY